jgi:hypothetical protein
MNTLLGTAALLAVVAASPLAFAQQAGPPDESTPGGAAAPARALPATPPEPETSNENVREDPNQRYYFVGLRYRGTVIPQFLVNLFVNEGGTFYSNTAGIELDMRKDGHSTIPWLAFTNYGFGDTLFEQKGKDPSDPGNWSVVSSGLSAIYLGLDEMWSSDLDEGHHFAFEFGFGVGIGAVFGDLHNDWVTPNPTGSLHSSDHGNYNMCNTVNDGPGCSPADHQNATINKVGGYVEPNWFNGGSVPVIFPHVSFPQLGLRWKPIKQLETRLGLGFSLTGFWFGLSADYGLEKPKHDTTAGGPSLGRATF